MLQRYGRAIIATDGSSLGDLMVEKIATFGIAVGDRVWGGYLGGLDQTSYMSEVWGLYKLLASITDMEGEIWVIIDNNSVQKEAEARRLGRRSGDTRNAQRIWRAIAANILRVRGIRFDWVPSHGKKVGPLERWDAPEGHDSGYWRELNDAADKEAARLRDLRWGREKNWRDVRDRAGRRADAALKRVHRGSEHFREDYPEQASRFPSYLRKFGKKSLQ